MKPPPDIPHRVVIAVAEPTWPDPSTLLVHALGDADLDVPDQVLVGTDTPPDLDGIRFLRVHVLGGRDDGVTETSRFDLDAHAPDLGEAIRLAHAARDYLLHHLPGSNPGGLGLVDAVRVEVRPRRLFYRNADVYRVVGTYTIDMRLQ